jgi:hypothetical protein
MLDIFLTLLVTDLYLPKRSDIQFPGWHGSTPSKKEGGKRPSVFLSVETHCIIRLLKNAHLLRFPQPSSLRRTSSTPHSSGFQGPCIWAFLSSPKINHFFSNLLGHSISI